MARISKGAIKRAGKKSVRYEPGAAKATRRALSRIEEGRWPGHIGPGVREVAMRRAMQVTRMRQEHSDRKVA